MRTSNLAVAMALAAAAVAGPSAAQPKKAAAPAQVVTGPVSTYWLSVETTAGIGAGSSGGGKPSLGSIMGAMRGGGGPSHRLTLQLGSSLTAAAPAAAHSPPPGLGLGPSLPLLTPRAAVAAPETPSQPGEAIPKEYQRPKGRLLIFWGCGEHARPGQPLVLDFAQMSQGRIPTAALGAMKGLSYTPMHPPSAARFKTYGEWPNERSKGPPPPTASLVGAHAVAGDYTAPISFALSPSQDFMPALSLQTAKAASGAAQLSWTPSSAARGYLALAIGGGAQDTVALWISAEGQAAAFGLPDYLTPADLSRLVAQRALLPANASSCAVPKEFVDAAPAALATLAGYGDEANFSFPPRPADPRTPWNIDWTVKARYRSADSAILGMDMAATGGAPATAGGRSESAGASAPSGQSARDAVMRGLGSAIGRGILGGR